MEISLDADMDGFLAEIAETDRKLVAGIRDAVDTSCKEGASEARNNHRWKGRTGDLEGKIRGRQVSSSARGAKGELVSLSTHSGFVNNGTPAHDIYPKAAADAPGPLPAGQSRGRNTADANAMGPLPKGTRRGRKVLAFEVGGKMVFASVVHHPGTAPDPFFDHGVAKTEEVLVREVEKVIDEVTGG